MVNDNLLGKRAYGLYLNYRCRCWAKFVFSNLAIYWNHLRILYKVHITWLHPDLLNQSLVARAWESMLLKTPQVILLLLWIQKALDWIPCRSLSIQRFYEPVVLWIKWWMILSYICGYWNFFFSLLNVWRYSCFNKCDTMQFYWESYF